MRKKSLFLLMAFFYLFTFPMSIQAAESNVSDCLKAEEDCLQDSVNSEISTDETENERTESNNFSTTSLFFNIIKMVVALLLVLVLIYLLLLFIRKRNTLFDQAGNLENVGGISVGQNKSIQIVRIGSKMY